MFNTAELIYDFLSQIYGNNMVDDVAGFLAKILSSLRLIFQNHTLSAIVHITIGAAGALLICYFYMDVISKASADMMTAERLILNCIKLFIGFVILIYLPDILEYIFKFADGMFVLMRDSDLSLNFGGGSLPKNFYFGKASWPEYKVVQNDFEAVFKSGASGLVKAIPFVLSVFLPYILMWVARIAAFIITVSNALMLIMQVIYSPIAVANVFDGGMKSESIRYMKKMLSTAITFSIIIVALKASQVLGDSILYNAFQEAGIKKLTATEEGLRSAISMSIIFPVCLVKLAAVGAMFSAKGLASSIVGSADGH